MEAPFCAHLNTASNKTSGNPLARLWLQVAGTPIQHDLNHQEGYYLTEEVQRDSSFGVGSFTSHQPASPRRKFLASFCAAILKVLGRPPSLLTSWPQGDPALVSGTTHRPPNPKHTPFSCFKESLSRGLHPKVSCSGLSARPTPVPVPGPKPTVWRGIVPAPSHPPSP